MLILFLSDTKLYRYQKRFSDIDMVNVKKTRLHAVILVGNRRILFKVVIVGFFFSFILYPCM